MKKKRQIFFYILLIISYFPIIGQSDSSKQFYIEPVYQYGFIWQHRPSLADIIGGNINVARISFGKTSNGKSFWEHLYRFPDHGEGYSFTDLGNPDKLGQANAIYYYLRMPVIKRSRFSLSYKISGGLAYLNQGSIAIGSHLNLYFDASLDAKVRLSKRINLINAFGATHYSNGAIVMPNLGVNLFSYRIGIQYNIHKPPYERLQAEFPAILHKQAITVVAGAGIKEKRPDGGKKYTVSSMSVDYMRILGHKHKVGLGVDIFYDETLFDLIDPTSTMSLTTTDIMRYGIHLSGEARYKKLVLAVHLGTYLKARYKNDGKIYQRVAIRYLFTENLFANISLKTSKGIADFVEWGIGYSFGI